RAVHREDLIVDVGAEERVFRLCELDPDERRLESADEHEEESRRAVEDADLLVIDSRHPVPHDVLLLRRVCGRRVYVCFRGGHFGLPCDYFRLSRYAATARTSWSVRPVGGSPPPAVLVPGISVPGFTACGSRIHSTRFSWFISVAPAPTHGRLPSIGRLGPTAPAAGVPAIA